MKDFYFEVILPAVKYSLVLWGSYCNSDLFKSIERLFCRAASIIYYYLRICLPRTCSDTFSGLPFLFIVSKVCVDFLIGRIASLYLR